jgi:hypothetical protein
LEDTDVRLIPEMDGKRRKEEPKEVKPADGKTITLPDGRVITVPTDGTGNVKRPDGDKKPEGGDKPQEGRKRGSKASS